MESDRPVVLRQAMRICRKGGTLSIPGVYSGFIDKIPFGVAFAKSLTIRMGQTHMQRHMRPLLERVQRGEIDPSFIITHRLPLANAGEAYEMFARKDNGCIKVVLKPDLPPAPQTELEVPARAGMDRETDWSTPRSKRLQPK